LIKPATAETPKNRGAWLRTLSLFAALLGFYLPWLNNAAASLSANAFDLAEWVGLSPALRGANPPMLASFFLRAGLAGLALLFGLRARAASSGLARLAFAGLALILALTLLPPLEFFRGNWDDVNYRQLMGLCLGALIGLGVIVFLGRQRRLPWRSLEILVTALSMLCALLGEVQALNVINTLRIPAPLGIGCPVFVISLFMHRLWLAPERREQQNAQIARDQRASE
jgi:hypothetical protein